MDEKFTDFNFTEAQFRILAMPWQCLVDFHPVYRF